MHPLVTTQWLKDHLAHPDLVLLDSSTKTNIGGVVSEYEGCQIPGSRWLDLDGKFSDPESTLPHTLLSSEIFQDESRRLGINKSSKIVVYDNLGIYTSPRVWWMFRCMGHENVHVLDGGLPGWAKAGYELEPSRKEMFAPGDFESDYRPEMVRSMADLVENLETKTSLVVDARSAGRFTGKDPEPREWLSSGHIPNSVNVPYQEVLDGHQYKSKEDLKTIFKEAGVGDQPLIFSCGSGLTACIVLLASEMVRENTASLYDGSWTEWASSEGMPIEKS